MAVSGVWEPYFKPSRRVHESGFRCFECGYLQMDKKARKTAKKVVIANSVDHITNWLLGYDGIDYVAVQFDMDLLKDGNIRVFSHRQPVFWEIPGFDDAGIATSKDKDVCGVYDKLDEMWEKNKK